MKNPNRNCPFNCEKYASIRFIMSKHAPETMPIVNYTSLFHSPRILCFVDVSNVKSINNNKIETHLKESLKKHAKQ